ncbi:hypothetical protein JHK86_016101 [Glycine max]|nr:hypothetical protein JHK86_016101 [Glycine max]
MIGMEMEYFDEKQRVKNEEFRRIMQQAITTQFSNLEEDQLLNPTKFLWKDC